MGGIIGFLVAAFCFGVGFGHNVAKKQAENDFDEFLKYVDKEYTTCENVPLAYTKWKLNKKK